ncbi:MAG: hypothetical protein ACREMK_00620 [Gemmatimonadota bacterium]
MFRAVLASIPLVLMAFLAGCQEESDELLSAPAGANAATIDAACETAPDICDLIEALFPAPGLENAAFTRFGNVARVLGNGDLDEAVGQTFDLIVFVFQKDLDDPNGSAPPTTDEGRIQLANLLLEFIGLNGILGSGDFVICQPNVKCVFETETRFAGFSGTFTELTLLTIARLPDNTFESRVDVTGFPLIFDFSATSASDAMGESAGLALASAPLAEPATVAVCVVDPPDPAAPDEDELANLALGHIIQGSEGDSVEILPDAPPGDFALDCEGASSEDPPPVEIVSLRWWGERVASAFEPVSEYLVSPLLANPGERRGLMTAFSPVGGIDTRTVGDGDGGDGGPTTTTLLLNGNAAGLSTFHGQITEATAIVAPTPGNVLEPSVNFVISLGLNQQIIPAFLDDGEATITIQCDAFDEIASEADAEIGPNTYFIQALFPGAGDFEASPSGFLTLGCSEPIG